MRRVFRASDSQAIRVRADACAAVLASSVRGFRWQRPNEIAVQSGVIASCASGGHGKIGRSANARIHLSIEAHDVAARLCGVIAIGGV